MFNMNELPNTEDVIAVHTVQAKAPQIHVWSTQRHHAFQNVASARSVANTALQTKPKYRLGHPENYIF